MSNASYCIAESVEMLKERVMIAERNRRWTELSGRRRIDGPEWAEVKQHVEWLYRRIKALELDVEPGDQHDR